MLRQEFLQDTLAIKSMTVGDQISRAKTATAKDRLHFITAANECPHWNQGQFAHLPLLNRARPSLVNQRGRTSVMVSGASRLVTASGTSPSIRSMSWLMRTRMAVRLS